MPKKSQLKLDTYRKVRGGYSRLLGISCEHCGHKVLVYQKDGPGELRRLYVDRIFEPESFSKFKNMPTGRIPELRCSHCKRVLGVPYLYNKEKRNAFRLFVGAVTKKVTGLK